MRVDTSKYTVLHASWQLSGNFFLTLDAKRPARVRVQDVVEALDRRKEITAAVKSFLVNGRSFRGNALNVKGIKSCSQRVYALGSDPLIWIIIAAIIFFIIVVKVVGAPKAGKSPARRSVSPGQHRTEQGPFKARAKWLKERWRLAEAEKDSENFSMFKPWYFEDATSAQIHRIEKMGFTIAGKPTKGRASDIIGLFEPADEWAKTMLKFFKVPVKGLNQTRAKYEVDKLMADPGKADAWKNRPASPIQREYFRYLLISLPKGISHPEAEDLIAENDERLRMEAPEELKDWAAYKSIYLDLIDPEFRQDNEIKKVNLSIYRSLMSQFKKDGKRPSEIDVNDAVDRLVIEYPKVSLG